MIIDQIVFLTRQDICFHDRKLPGQQRTMRRYPGLVFVKNKDFSAEGKFPPDAKNVRQESKNGRYSQMALITSLTTLKAISPMNTPMATSAALFGSISSSMDLSFCWLVVDIFDRFGGHVGWFAAQAIPSATWKYHVLTEQHAR